MRARTLATLLALVPALLPAVVRGQEPDHWLIAVVQGVGNAGLRVHAGPSADTTPGAVLAEGQYVTIVESAGSNADRWYRIAPVGRADPTPNGWVSAAYMAVADSINLRAAASAPAGGAGPSPVTCCTSAPRPPPAPRVAAAICQTAIRWSGDPVAMVREGQEAALRAGLTVSQEWSELDAVALAGQAVTLLLAIPDRFERFGAPVVLIVILVSADARGYAEYSFDANAEARRLAAWQVCTGDRVPSLGKGD
jgi:hypothetical protein